ncbi:beta-N-acetylhexosaminidase [Streptomyces sp. MAR4 CNX-425]|uniref:beta-N-acetylhexosaminidase n=1 Tax=Streptomyces sp. MAR4 CNX-425 TaxID=3406343 RepID=UPI003B511684
MRRHPPDRRLPRLGVALLVAVAAALGAGASPAAPGTTAREARAAEPVALDSVIPAPAEVAPGGSPYEITAGSAIRVPPGRSDAAVSARAAGEYLAGVLRPSTGFELPVGSESGDVELRLRPGLRKAVGPEGYELTSGADGVLITAAAPAGLFHGVQTLRQLLPPAVEADTPQDGPWPVAGGRISDEPRFAYRSAMLDVARHFFTVEQVKRYVDQLALYKYNTLHLHLTDDQGWRLAIDSWPRLAEYGGSTQVGGGEGGFYTKDQYREIVAYAASRHMTVVPEVDMPGHTNAALASYAELNCDGVAPPLYTGTQVGFSTLCVPKEVTYDFVDDVVRELAELTPGPYIHIGGDEAHSTPHDEYVAFMERAQAIVAKYGKTVVGWHQIAGADPADGAVAQYWGTSGDEQEVIDAAKAGTPVVLSPANRTYLDMKYHEGTPLGLSWAGYVEVRQSYDWDPGTYLGGGVPESAILGVEAPLWSETLTNSDEIEFMAFPRAAGAAELGWSPAAKLGWDGYRDRLVGQGPRWERMGVDFYRSAQVPWE